jgi:hypothetical protein
MMMMTMMVTILSLLGYVNKIVPWQPFLQPL